MLAGLSLACGLGITIWAAIDQQRSAEQRYAQAICINDRIRNNWPIKMKSYDQTKVDFDATGCPSGPFYYESVPTIISYAKDKPGSLEYAIQPIAYGGLASIIIAAVLFYACWLVGWLCAGFTRD